jgi:hypothetical protein
MKWLEIIKLRSVGGSEGLLEKIALSAAEVGQNGFIKIEFFRHAFLETDLSLHLKWDSEEPEMNGSAPGLRLAQALKDFGLVDHSIWIEKEK